MEAISIRALREASEKGQELCLRIWPCRPGFSSSSRVFEITEVGIEFEVTCSYHQCGDEIEYHEFTWDELLGDANTADRAVVEHMALLQKREDERQAASRARHEKEERDRYERLKSKFEPEA